MDARFRVARNPDPGSHLPYLVWLPIEGGVVLKARDAWPRAARVFCAQDASPWDDGTELVDEAAVLVCKRRGAAIDLILDRPQLARSQFVFTNARGRPAIWWQTQTTGAIGQPGSSGSTRASIWPAGCRRRHAREIRLALCRPASHDRAAGSGRRRLRRDC